MKKYIINILFIIIPLCVFAEDISYFIGTAHNKTADIKTGSVFVVKRVGNSVDGKIFYGAGLYGSGDFKSTINGNKFSFVLHNIKYTMTFDKDNLSGQYITNNNQHGELSYRKITDSNESAYERTGIKIVTESELNSDRKILENLFSYFHPIGKPYYLTVDDVSLTKDNGKIIMIEFRCSLYWEGPIQKGCTKFKFTEDRILNRISQPELISTTGLTNEQSYELAGLGLYMLLDSMINSQ